MYDKKSILMLTAMAMMSTISSSVSEEYYPEFKIDRAPVKPKGHKQFWIKGVEIWALNQKNAIKKYEKMNV